MVNSHVNSLFGSVSYRIGNLLIDPGDEWYGMDSVEAILLTHAHFDHIYGLNHVIEKNPNAKVYTNAIGAEMLVDAKKNLSKYHEKAFILATPDSIVIVNDIDEIEFTDGIKVKALFTPGHNPSCISWQIGDNLFTGDSYIPGIKTVTNLPGADKKQALESEAKLKRLGERYQIFPGHYIES